MDYRVSAPHCGATEQRGKAISDIHPTCDEIFDRGMAKKEPYGSGSQSVNECATDCGPFNA